MSSLSYQVRVLINIDGEWNMVSTVQTHSQEVRSHGSSETQIDNLRDGRAYMKGC